MVSLPIFTGMALLCEHAEYVMQTFYVFRDSPVDPLQSELEWDGCLLTVGNGLRNPAHQSLFHKRPWWP